MKELKKENRDTSNAMMLPRQSNNNKKYEIKRKNSFEGKPKMTGMAAIHSKMENQKPKKTITRPQTSVIQKGGLMKDKTGIPGVKSGISKPRKFGRENPR